MPLTNIMGKPLKHYAIDKNTNERYIILALENETDKNTCSVIEMDKIDSDLRSELTETINSDEMQREIDTWKLLDVKFFMNYPKQTMLAVLKALHVIKVLSTEDVMVILPGDAQKSAKEVMEDIRMYRKKVNDSKLGIVTSNDVNTISNRELEEINNKINSHSTGIKLLSDEVSTIKVRVEELNNKLNQIVSLKKSSKK